MTKQVQMTATAMRGHVHQLAAAFGARVIEANDLAIDAAAANPVLRVVVCRPVVDEVTYAIALHELGHVFSPLGYVRNVVDGDRGNLLRIEEAAAWEWARHYALVWSVAMEQVATLAEGTYQSTSQVDDPPAPVAPNQRINWNDWK